MPTLETKEAKGKATPLPVAEESVEKCPRVERSMGNVRGVLPSIGGVRCALLPISCLEYAELRCKAIPNS
jgi:hypothetical protein